MKERSKTSKYTVHTNGMNTEKPYVPYVLVCSLGMYGIEFVELQAASIENYSLSHASLKMANNNGQKRRLPVAIRLEYKLLSALLFKYCDEEVTGTALLFNVLYRNDAGKLAKIAIISSKKATISDLLELVK